MYEITEFLTKTKSKFYPKLTSFSNSLINFFNKHTLLIGIGFVIFLWLPFLILGEHAYLQVRDNLDDFIVKRILLSLNFFKWPWQTIKEVLGGTPRCFLTSSLDISTFFYYLFPPFVVYSINEWWMKVIAFLGMLLFCRKYIGSSSLISFISAALFAMLPFMHYYGLGITGLPLVFYSFFNILKRQSKFTDYLFLVAFPFCSLAVLTGFWLLPLFFLILLFDFYKTKRFSRSAFWVILLMGILYLLVEYNLIYQLYQSIVLGNQDYVTHRIANHTNFNIKDSIIYFFFSSSFYPILSFAFILIILEFFGYVNFNIKQNFLKLKNNAIEYLFSNTLLLMLIFTVLTYGLKVIGLENRVLHLGRVNTIFPVFYYFIFAFFLNVMNKKNLRTTILIFAIGILQTKYNFSNNVELRKNFIETYRTIFSSRQSVDQELFYYKNVGHMSWKSFYSEKLYSQIANFIGKDKSSYMVVSIGIEQMIALYNGFLRIGRLFF